MQRRARRSHASTSITRPPAQCSRAGFWRWDTGTGRERGRVELLEIAAPFNFESAHRATLERFKRGRVDATALVGANDTLAIGALRALKDLGVNVPDDVSVAGVDDVALAGSGDEGARLAAYITPSLTTVRVPVADIARTGVLRLLQMIEAAEGPPARQPSDTIWLPPQLIERESTGPAPAGHAA